MIPHSKPFLGEEEIKAVTRVLRSGHLAQGLETAAFEAECAALVGRRYGVAVSSGTSALQLALSVFGIAADESVAIPSYACASLAQAVCGHRATPVLCEIGEDYNIAPQAVPAGVRCAIVPHLFGAHAVLPEVEMLVEDIAQSIGGPTGTRGLVSVASFYATKLCTTGEGGMLLTDDEGLAESARDRRDYDNRDDFVERFACKMTDFQAAMGRVQLRRLPGFIARRREIAGAYATAFSGLPLGLPTGKDHVYFRYVIATPMRDGLEQHLRACGVEAKRPVYRPAHHYLGGAFVRAEQAHEQLISLPIYPGLLPAELQTVIESVRAFYDGAGGA